VNAYTIKKAQERLKTQHQITAVISVCKFIFNEIISVNVSKTKTDVFITIVLRFFRWNLLIFTSSFILKKR